MTSAADCAADNLALILTADCNLRCRYCYQNAKHPRAMPWAVLRAALDAMLAPPPRPRTIWFSGGEPTLRWASIERAVEYVERRAAPPGLGPVVYRITTNGLLLGPARLAFLAARDFRVTLSMDGVQAAQDLRGRGTFDRLDRLLRRWRAQHPEHFRHRCRAAVTVTRAAIPHLADSVRHLFARGVPEIVLEAAAGEYRWTAADLALLDGQLARVEAASLEHSEQTGEIPVSAFRKEPRARGRAPGGGRWPCGAPSGRTLAVDVDGAVYPCVLAARSYQRFDDPETDRKLACLVLGNVREGVARLKPAEAAAAASGLFGPTRLQHSAARRCASCPVRDECLVCPIARAKEAPAGDPYAVPGYICAFNRLLQEHARRFRRHSGLAEADLLLSRLFSSLSAPPPGAQRSRLPRTGLPSP